MKPLTFLIPAENEMLEAASYYESKANNLGRSYISEVERSKNIIAQTPELYPIKKYDIRHCIVRRFPYAILYKNDPDEIIVIAVMHLRRKPDYWVDRVKDL
jgi:plasmid stabilization system protein ParE